MRKKLFAGLVLSLVFLGLMGCAGPRNVAYVDGDGKKYAYSDTDSYDDLDITRPMIAKATAYAIQKDADTRNLWATSKPKPNDNDLNLMAVVNNSPRRSMYFWDPSSPGMKYDVPANGNYAIVNIPKELKEWRFYFPGTDEGYRLMRLPRLRNPVEIAGRKVWYYILFE